MVPLQPKWYVDQFKTHAPVLKSVAFLMLNHSPMDIVYAEG